MGVVLVTGGAGYVGSHIVRKLVERKREVLVLDDFSEGHRAALGAKVPVVEADFGDPAVLDGVLAEGRVSHIVHMAAFALVGESVAQPARYYANNLAKSLVLLEAARQRNVQAIVFSSSAAVYGDPSEIPIPEEHPRSPTNPYGETKFAFENALAWYHRAYGLRYVSLRYFNAAGAHPDGDLGEDHRGETHLIPRLLRSVIDDGPETPIHGEDYPTTDGTCVRDYVHVVDLAEAHVAAIEATEKGKIDAEAINLGIGEGFSVREVVDAVAKITGTRPKTSGAPRRPGDPAILVASGQRAARRLGWKPEFRRLEEIVRTAWEWHRSHPRGFDEPAADRSEGGAEPPRG